MNKVKTITTKSINENLGEQCIKCKSYSHNYRKFKNGTFICDDCFPNPIPLEMLQELDGASTSTIKKKTYKQ